MVDWPMIRLGDLLTRSDETIQIDPTASYREITVKLWGKGVVERGQVSGSSVSTDRKHVARCGQFIASRIDARNGALGIVPLELDGAIVSNDFPVFNIERQRLLPEFLGWMVKTQAFVDKCIRASEGTTNRVRLQGGRFDSIEIPLPPLPEQRRIVARIEALAAEVEEARGVRRSSGADQHRMLLSAYHQLVLETPLRSLGDIAPLERRPVEIDLSETYLELGVRSFGRGTFHKPGLTGADLGSKRVFWMKPGDLVFNIVFAWEGAVAVVREIDRGRIGSHRFVTCVPRIEVARSSFLCFHFLTTHGLEQLGAASPGGAGRNRTLGLKSLLGTKVPLPPYNRQLWLETLIDEVERAQRLQSETAAELDALMPAILDRAFKGEL